MKKILIVLLLTISSTTFSQTCLRESEPRWITKYNMRLEKRPDFDWLVQFHYKSLEERRTYKYQFQEERKFCLLRLRFRFVHYINIELKRM